ncbi:MAG: anti-sigma F factor [Bacillota bacterium]
MYDNEMHVSFLSCSQNESFARIVAGAFASQLNPTIEELTDIRTAVSEAVTNAIIHGYENRPGMVTMDCYLSGNVFSACIRDDGAGMSDVEQARQPFYTSKANLERSGMGFTMMEAFMDTLEVESTLGKGTSVRMTKRIREVADE